MDNDFRDMINEHMGRYPVMEPRDILKLAFQNEFGPEHMITGRENAAASIMREAALCSPASHAAEPIGNGLCRFHLSDEIISGNSSDMVAELFILTAAEHHGSPEGLWRKLSMLKELIPSMAHDVDTYISAGCPAVHHSDAFRKAYDPHYRVLNSAYACFFSALTAVRAAADRGGPCVISVDGRCGSGKTTLADLVSKLFDCNVFHMDDFYLPPGRRAGNWQTIPGGNMDLQRFRNEVLLPAVSGMDISYRAFDCHTGSTARPVLYSAKPLTVIEGSYSQHPDLRDLYSLKVFLTCSPEVQANRIAEREGPYSDMFRRLWIPLEEHYFSASAIAGHADMIIDTSVF